MKLLNKRMPDNFDLYLIGDDHTGNVAQYGHGLESVIDEIASNKMAYAIHMGDEIDAVASDDKRFNPKIAHSPIPMEQAYAAVEVYRPIRNKILSVQLGNHPDTLSRFGNLTRDIFCKELGVPYGTTSCVFTFKDKNGRQMFKGFFVHGYRRAKITSNAKDYEQRRANMMAQLKMALASKACDCLLMGMGHVHKLLVVPPAKRLILRSNDSELKQNYLELGDGRADYIEPDRRYYFCSGSFLRTYCYEDDTYAEKAGYDPVELGYVKATIRDRKLVGVEAITID